MGFNVLPKKSITIAFMLMENDGVVVNLTESETDMDSDYDTERIIKQHSYSFAKANKAVRFVNENIKSMVSGLKETTDVLQEREPEEPETAS